MSGIIERGNTFNLPNYPGELIAVSPTDTKFLSSIGGLTGGESAPHSPLFGWQTSDLRDADSRARREGQDAPAGEARVRAFVKNVAQIVHETVDISYTKLAATGQTGDLGFNHPHADGLQGEQPVGNESNWQVDQALKQIARDLEWTFINGDYQEPSTNASARQTKGIIQASVTNRSNVGLDIASTDNQFTVTVANPGVFTVDTGSTLADGDQVQFVEGSGVLPTAVQGPVTRKLTPGRVYYVVNFVDGGAASDTFEIALTPGGASLEVTAAGTDHATRQVLESAALTEDALLNLMQDVYDEGGIHEEETATLMVNSWNKRQLTKIFVTQGGYRQNSRNVGGVAVDTIITDFGELNVMLNRHMPNGAIQVVSLEQCAPVFLEIPGKGFLFAEPLGKRGAYDDAQIYGEVGLKYGNEKAHGVLLGLKASA